MRIINRPIDKPVGDERPIVPIPVDRRALAKRRWRGTAADGMEFGFDLDHPLKNGAFVFATDSAAYAIEQAPESLLRIPFTSSEQAARYGWMVGNLHFSADFSADAVVAEDDDAVRQMLDRNHIDYSEIQGVFAPAIVSRGHRH